MVIERGNRALRFLDRRVGIPLVFTLGLLRPKRKLPERIDRIGLFLFAAIGDGILASAIIEDLRRSYPAATVVGFLSAANRELAGIVQGFDDIVVVPLAKPITALRAIRQRPLDLVVDTHPWSRISALLSALAGARFTVGFSTKSQYRHFAYDRTADHRADRHELENIRDLARCLGVEPRGVPRLSPAVYSAVVQPLLDRPYVVLHPWASGFQYAFREWPMDRWAALARALIDGGQAIVITGGPADRGRALDLVKAIGSEHVVMFAGSHTLFETAVVLRDATAVVCVNTGVMHLAAALGCRMVALHGPTNPLRFGPLDPYARIVGPGPDAGGAYLDLGFEYPRHPTDIMVTITVDQVLEALAMSGKAPQTRVDSRNAVGNEARRDAAVQ